MDATSFGVNGSSSRRRFLQAVGLGGVAASAPLAAVTAGAQAPTTAPPRRPTDEDTELLRFAQSVELAAVAAYDLVIDRSASADLAVPTDLVPVVHALREHHRAYADSLASLLGRDAPGTANAKVIETVGGPFASGSATEVLEAAAGLENVATATHGSIVGRLVGLDGAALIASIMSMEARHATTLTAIAGSTDPMPAAGLEDLSTALSPDDFPVE